MSEQEPDDISVLKPAELAARIHAGDGDAERELVRRYSRGLLMLLRKRSNDPTDAEDFHQEAFRLVIERLRARELEDPEKLAQFIRNTATNVLIGSYRKHARRNTTSDMDSVFRSADPTPGIIDRISSERRRALVRELLQELPVERDREVLRRFYLTVDDKAVICTDLELTPTHFDRVLYRAKQRFRELITREAGSAGKGAAVGELSVWDQ